MAGGYGPATPEGLRGDAPLTTLHRMTPADQRVQMLKGVLDLCLLAVLDDEPEYGFGIVRRLEAAGLPGVAEGSVYPALARLERAGLILGERQPSATGPPRKYYRPTDRGREQLERWRAEWLALAGSVQAVLEHTEATR